MERILKAETLLPVLTALLLTAALFSCKKEEPFGRQYSLTREFKECTLFPRGTKWIYRDANRGDTFSLTLISARGDTLMAGPGYNGYLYYDWGFRFLADSTIIPLPKDTIPDDTTNPDTARGDTVNADTVPGRSWRVLPYDAALAGSIVGTQEQVLFFHDSTTREGRTFHGLTYRGQVTRQVLGDDVSAYSFTGPGVAGDTLSAVEMDWVPKIGLVRFKTLSGRVFELYSKRP